LGPGKGSQRDLKGEKRNGERKTESYNRGPKESPWVPSKRPHGGLGKKPERGTNFFTYSTATKAEISSVEKGFAIEL
jgi:hypothetical protein